MPDGLVSLLDDDGYFIVLEVPPLLRGSVDFFCSLGGTPSLSVQGLEVKVPQVGLWDWNPSLGLAPNHVWGNSGSTLLHVMT